ncbi:MAG: HNH endonuclease [Roseiflexaceae bacterium]
MRRIKRQTLAPDIEHYLAEKQSEANDKRNKADNKKKRMENFWNNNRQSEQMNKVFTVLRDMAGPRRRCMYCVDSEGHDIDHFWPKSSYPERMFHWINMLLCCPKCGRLKSNKFPLDSNNEPLLIDPTVDDPWQFLEFDPRTGNIVPRLDELSRTEMEKGVVTVEILQLDSREAIATGCQSTFEQISTIINEALVEPVINSQKLIEKLSKADHHGLLGWCFHGTGVLEQPFADLRRQHPSVWEACCSAFQ